MNITEARKVGISELKSSNPRLDVDVLLKWILSCDETFLLFHGDKELLYEQEKLFFTSVEKRKSGLPIAYITGKKEFFGYEFSVNQDVLIPKPDTEILVENAINFIEEKFIAENRNKVLSICDMCSGSGCVGVSILKSIEEYKIIPISLLPRITFVDLSKKTL